jgi:hypothetical protein
MTPSYSCGESWFKRAPRPTGTRKKTSQVATPLAARISAMPESSRQVRRDTVVLTWVIRPTSRAHSRAFRARAEGTFAPQKPSWASGLAPSGEMAIWWTPKALKWATTSRVRRGVTAGVFLIPPV